MGWHDHRVVHSCRSALIAQGIEHRFPKPRVAGSNPAGGTVREWPILAPPAQTAPSQLPVRHPRCPRNAGLYCSLMHANCTAAVLAASPGCVSGTANQGPWARGLSRGPRVFHALGRPHVAPGRGSNEQARRRRSRNARPVRPPIGDDLMLAYADLRSLCTRGPVISGLVVRVPDGGTVPAGQTQSDSCPQQDHPRFTATFHARVALTNG